MARPGRLDEAARLEKLMPNPSSTREAPRHTAEGTRNEDNMVINTKFTTGGLHRQVECLFLALPRHNNGNADSNQHQQVIKALGQHIINLPRDFLGRHRSGPPSHHGASPGSKVVLSSSTSERIIAMRAGRMTFETQDRPLAIRVSLRVFDPGRAPCGRTRMEEMKASIRSPQFVPNV